MSIYIKKQKTIFSILSVSLLLTIVFGINFFGNKGFYLIKNTADYVLHSMSFYSNELSSKVVANTVSVFNDKEDSNEKQFSIVDSKNVPILLYHGIVENPDRFSLTLSSFKDQMFALKEAGYQTISLKDLEDFIYNDKILPNKSFLITFDDGRRDSYEKADPLLKALGYTAVMFVAIDASIDHKSNYYISTDEIRDMIKSGRWEIGSHAVQEGGGYVSVSKYGEKGNFLSSRKWLDSQERLEALFEYTDRVKYELGDSRGVLEETLEVGIDSFSYPFGDYGQQSVNNTEAVDVIRSVIEDNYKMAFKQVWPTDVEYTFNYPDTDPYLLKRIEVPTDWSGQDLMSFLTISQDKALPFVDKLDTKNKGWKRTWGTFAIEDNKILLYSHASTTGASIFLDGTRLWKNYTFTSTLDWIKGTHVSLVARYRDDKNYNVCTFGDDFVKIESVIDGKIKKLSQEENFVKAGKEDLSIGILVKDDFIECIMDDKVVTYATIKDEDGGIGVKIWDKEYGNAEINIKSVSVTN